MKKLLLAGLLVLLTKAIYGQLSKSKAEREMEKITAKASRKGNVRMGESTVSDKLAALSKVAAEKSVHNAKLAAKLTGEYHGHQIYTGPEGGMYYINSHGNKTYIN